MGKLSKRDDVLATVLAGEIGDNIRYDHLRSRWLVWNGTRWRPDLTQQMYDLIKTTAAAQLSNPAWDHEDRQALVALYDSAKKESVMKSLRSFPSIAMVGNEWDTDGDLIGFDNGIANLNNGTFYDKPDPGLLVSKTVGVDFDGKATCPEFEKFLDQIMDGDAELVAYLKRFIGYSLIGTQAEQKFWMWVGRGSNGKGILARTLRYVFGDYADAPSDTLYMRTRQGSQGAGAASPHLMRLQAIRFTYMSEPPGNQFNEELLKAHTGEDIILARDLYAKAGQMAEFSPTHKIVFLTNDPPKTDDVGVSMSRRVRVVRFEKSWDGTDPNLKPDMGLEDRLRREKAGILNLALREALAWKQDGMPEPDVVLQWSREYIAENDPLSEFFQDRCVIGYGEKGQASSLYNAYVEWSKAAVGGDAMSQHAFGRALGRKFTSTKTVTGKFYNGIRTKNAMEWAEGAEDDE